MANSGSQNHKPGGESGQRYDIFISHSTRRDPVGHELVDALAPALGRRGLTVFVDRSSLTRGMRLVQSLEEAIRKSYVGLVVVTRGAIASGWVALEGELMARQRDARRMRIVALRLDVDCPLPFGIAPEDVIDPPNRNDLTDIADRVAQIVRSGPPCA